MQTRRVPDSETLALRNQIVRLIGQRWANSISCNLEPNPRSETNGWPRSTRSGPDIVGWAQNTGRHTPLWIAKVETEDTIIEEKALKRWQDFSVMGAPFILIVPRGYKALAHFFATRIGVCVADVYEYALNENKLELT